MKAVKKEEPKKLTNSEALEDLKKQYEHYRTMMLKAQGAIEVLENLEKD
jgi:hypothetical protein